MPFHPAIWLGVGTALLLFTVFQRKKHSRILWIGDSHSEASWTLGGQTVTGLQQRGFESVKRVAHRGKGVHWYNNTGTLSREIAQFQPDLLIVLLGGNDAGQATEAEYARALQGFVATAKNGGVKRIIWFGPPRSDGPLAHKQPARQQIADWQRHYLGELGVEWTDSMDLTQDLPTRDGVHYSQPEYSVWSARALEVLDNVVPA